MGIYTSNTCARNMCVYALVMYGCICSHNRCFDLVTITPPYDEIDYSDLLNRVATSEVLYLLLYLLLYFRLYLAYESCSTCRFS